jgi:hypothetical protein
VMSAFARGVLTLLRSCVATAAPCVKTLMSHGDLRRTLRPMLIKRRTASERLSITV